MKFGVVVFPGSNCDDDMIHVLGRVMEQEVVKLWHKDHVHGLGEEDCIVLPGGFSYGDYLRSGAIARFSNIMSDVINHADKGGLVMGICNGFQILCEAGLLPGTLLRNHSQKFIAKNVWLQPQHSGSSITVGMDKNRVYKIPIAHADGRYYAHPEELARIEENNQVIFRYCDEKGQQTDDANPNGSINHIAGVCNAGRNVFGLMPHPERASEEELGNTDGKFFFDSLIKSSLIEIC